jgi:predicted DNA-binding transcriptional regulator AlpA
VVDVIEARYLRKGEMLKYLGLSVRTFAKLEKERKAPLPAIITDTVVRWDKEKLDDWMTERTTPTLSIDDKFRRVANANRKAA